MNVCDDMFEPFHWWYSGRLWYCFLERPGGKRASGAGATKPQAVDDARKELRKRFGSTVELNHK